MEVVVSLVADDSPEADDGIVTPAPRETLGDDRQLEGARYVENVVQADAMPVDSLDGAIKEARRHSFVEAGDYQSYREGRAVEFTFRNHGAVDYSAISALSFCEPVTFAGTHGRPNVLAFGHAALVIHTA